MERFSVPPSEIKSRLKRIQSELRQVSLDGLLVVQRVDLFYFSGTAQNAFLYIPGEGDPLLMVKRYYPRAVSESPIKYIKEIRSVKEVPGLIERRFGRLPRVLGMELDVVPVRDYGFYRGLFGGPQCEDASPLIQRVRMIKSEWEIRQMENTALLSSRTFDYIGAHIKAGYSETEFAGMFEAFARKLGHGGQLRVRDYLTEGYPWHVLSGRSGGRLGVLDSPSSGEGTSAAFPCGAGWRELAPGEPIMVDFNCVLNGYHFDETRMFSIGEMNKKALDASRAAIEIHDAVLREARPGARVDQLFRLSVSEAKALGYEEAYLGPPGYKVSFIGHGIGLELVEPPIIAEGRKDLLEPGMIFALEPKMVFEDEFAAGIESVFLVTETGNRLISRTPVEIFAR